MFYKALQIMALGLVVMLRIFSMEPDSGYVENNKVHFGLLKQKTNGTWSLTQALDRSKKKVKEKIEFQFTFKDVFGNFKPIDNEVDVTFDATINSVCVDLTRCLANREVQSKETIKSLNSLLALKAQESRRFQEELKGSVNSSDLIAHATNNVEEMKEAHKITLERKQQVINLFTAKVLLLEKALQDKEQVVKKGKRMFSGC